MHNEESRKRRYTIKRIWQLVNWIHELLRFIHFVSIPFSQFAWPFVCSILATSIKVSAIRLAIMENRINKFYRDQVIHTLSLLLYSIALIVINSVNLKKNLYASSYNFHSTYKSFFTIYIYKNLNSFKFNKPPKNYIRFEFLKFVVPI